MKKLPPLEKIYEAYTAVADGRVSMPAKEPVWSPGETGRAQVHSSDGSKTYEVQWSGDQYSSDDNGTYWQGYAGYPVIAVLMLQGRLPLDRKIAEQFAGINWKALNSEFGNDYAKALASVIDSRNLDRAALDGVVQEVYSLLGELPVRIVRARQL